MAFNYSAPSNTNAPFSGSSQWQASTNGGAPWNAGPSTQQGSAPAWSNAAPTQNQPWNGAPPTQQQNNGGAPPAWSNAAPTQQQNNGAAPPAWSNAPSAQQQSNGGAPWNGNGPAPAQNQPWNSAPPAQNTSQQSNPAWAVSPGNSNAPAAPAQTKTSIEVLGDALIELFDRYVRLQCIPTLVEGLQKEGMQVTSEKLTSMLPSKATIANSALLSSTPIERSLPAATAPSFAYSGMAIGVGQPNQQQFGPPATQGGAFNASGFMPAASASTADKNLLEKQKLLDPNFNDNYKPGGCLSYPVRGNEGKYRFCGNPVANQYTIVCEKCRSTRSSARDLDIEFTQKLTRREHFDFEGYRRGVTQKRINHARGTKPDKKGNTSQAPSFGFNPMDNQYNGMFNNGGQQQQQQQPMNNGPPMKCGRYTGTIPDELVQFTGPEHGVLVLFRNHRLVGLLKDVVPPNGGPTEQQSTIIAAADDVTGPMRKTNLEDWNMIKSSNFRFVGPYVTNYDNPQGGNFQPTVPQPQNNAAWNPNQGAAPWSQPTQTQPQQWNPNQGQSQQPQQWNPNQGQSNQAGPTPWSQPQPNQGAAPWSQPQPNQQGQQSNQSSNPWSQPDSQSQPNQAAPAWSQPQPTPDVQQAPVNTTTSTTSPSTQSNVAANIASTDSSLSFDAIMSGIASTPTPTPEASTMVVQQF